MQIEKTPEQLAKCLESSLFAAAATRQDFEKFCAAARKQGIYGVCVNGSRVELARTLLEESDVKVSALVGFPLGAGDTDVKRYEAETAVDQGAEEIDLVINVGRLKDGDRDFVLREMRDVVEAADERTVKAILEAHLLTQEEKILACQLALDSGVKFVVTSTDVNAPEVSIELVKFLRETVGDKFGIKAAGGIRDLRKVAALIEAGVTRIGMTAGVVLGS